MVARKPRSPNCASFRGRFDAPSSAGFALPRNVTLHAALSSELERRAGPILARAHFIERFTGIENDSPSPHLMIAGSIAGDGALG